MKLVKVGAAVLNQTPLDWRTNRRNQLAAIAEARAAGVSLLCLPELSIPGYGCEDAYQSGDTQRAALDELFELASATQGMIVAFGLHVQYRKSLFDCAAVVADGRLLGFVAKRFLAGDGVYYEPRWFKPWPERVLGQLDHEGRTYPIGDLYFVADGVSFGFEICEEAWVARRPGIDLAARGVDIMLNPSASHFSFGKHEVRRRFVLEGSRAFGVTYLYTNLAGNAAGRLIFDGGAMVASDGALLAEGPRFTHLEHAVTSVVVDVDATRLRQVRTGSFLPEFGPHPPERIVDREFVFPEIAYEVPPRALDPVYLREEDDKEEEFARAVPLALFDYLRKSRARGYVISLSGGADSAACACLVALMWRLAIAEIGLEGVRAKVPYLDWSTIDSEASLIRQTLLCVYQSTRNSGAVTREAARAVAEGVGAEFLELDVDELVQGYVGKVGAAIGRELAWPGDDIALQNIQARVRAPGVWLLANLRGFLLLTTSNRSEAAVGYATMDGDTAGGLAPIAGIDKHYLRHWLRWLERQGPHGLGPLAALAKVNVQPPTAELRPPGAHQTDEADLMPYDLLDAIERAAIGDKKAPLEVWRTLRPRFPAIVPAQLGAFVDRFFRLWCRNQWKRERYAPSFHLDDENLDPKTWCRFPILSGGYERELAELHAAIALEAAG